MFTDEEGKEIWWQRLEEPDTEIFQQISRAFRRAADFMTDCCHSRSISVVGCVSFLIRTHTLHPTGRFWALSCVSAVYLWFLHLAVDPGYQPISPETRDALWVIKDRGVHKCKPDPVIRVRASQMTLIDGTSRINRVTAEDSRSTQTQWGQSRSQFWTSSGK